MNAGPDAGSSWDAERAVHPRPQFLRAEWLSLDGEWEFGFDDSAEGFGAGWWTGRHLPHVIRVPYTFEAPLSGVGKGAEIHPLVWYRRLFWVPDVWRGQHLLLHFGAVDWRADVWCNGHYLGRHEGGYAPFCFDLADALAQAGPQEIVVAAYDPAEGAGGGRQPRGKQRGSGGIWYTRTTGIWQPVWLESVGAAHIRQVRIAADPDARRLTVTADLSHADDAELDAFVYLNGRSVATGSGHQEVSLVLDHVERWSPARPVLYDVRLVLRHAGRRCDEVVAYCGFRTVAIAGGMLTINGDPVFVRGVLDQGYWPDGGYTAPATEALRSDVQLALSFGFNLARKHVKVEDPRWYYWCDRLGVLVAQDMPSSDDLSTAESREAFARELADMVLNLAQSPAILLWIVFNEDWGRPGPKFQQEMVRLTRRLDPTRKVVDASGWRQGEDTDLRDVHDYGDELAHRRHDGSLGSATWVGEYGGVSWPVPGHLWGGSAWGYRTVDSAAALVQRYRTLTRQLQRPGELAGYVYTQLTDVESETNGLVTYDRSHKVDPAAIAEINNASDGAPRP